jgi:hypothetical protein
MFIVIFIAQTIEETWDFLFFMGGGRSGEANLFKDSARLNKNQIFE